MSNAIHQIFGYFNGKYYSMEDQNRIVIPNNMDYVSPAIVSKIHSDCKEAEIDIYQYHTDMATICNVERVKFMKEFLLGEKVTSINDISDQFNVGIKYEIYDKNGDIMCASEFAIGAHWCMALLMEDVKNSNMMEYRKALVLDGRIQIPIPQITAYGILGAMENHPYTFRIVEIFALSTKGGARYVTEMGSQMENCGCGVNPNHQYHCNNAQYNVKHHNGLCDLNFNSCFITNAKIGTSIIDNVVASAVLEAPQEYEKIPLCSIPMEGGSYTIKFNAPLKRIIVNMEFLIDNLNEVYDREDIRALLEMNANPEVELPEDDVTDEVTPTDPENT